MSRRAWLIFMGVAILWGIPYLLIKVALDEGVIASAPLFVALLTFRFDVTYLNPVVALVLGMAILGERPGMGAMAGLLLIVGGSWLSTQVQPA